MKNLYSLCVLSLCLSLVACGGNKQGEDEHTNHPPKVSEVAEAEQADNGKQPMADGDHKMADMNGDGTPQMRHITANKGNITVFNATAKPSTPGQSVSSAYLIITNAGDKDVEVTAISSDASKVTEAHTMSMADSKMVMRKMDKVVIPANGELSMVNKNHIMFIDLLKPLEAGNEVKIEFTLDNGDVLEFAVPVEDPNAVAEETKADEAKADEAKADEAKADEAKADEAKADEAKADEAKADEAKAEDK